MLHSRCFPRLVSIALLAFTAGCERSVAPPIPASAPTRQSSASLRITDGLGRSIELAQPAERIVSLAPSCTEILFAIGAGEHVVGVTSFADYPPEARQREQVGGMTRETINVEKILGLQPDLIFAAGTLQRDLIEDLIQLELCVVAFEPHSIQDILSDIRTAGILTGRSAAAQQVIRRLSDELAYLDTCVEQIPSSERPTVFYEVWERPLRTVSSSSYLGELITRAGGQNVFADLREPYPLVSEEAVVKLSPEVILAPAHPQASAAQFRSRPAWRSVAAVERGQIVFLDENLVSRPGPRVAGALRAIAQALHGPDFAQAPEKELAE